MAKYHQRNGINNHQWRNENNNGVMKTSIIMKIMAMAK
jgi:hypothetical protein